MQERHALDKAAQLDKLKAHDALESVQRQYETLRHLLTNGLDTVTRLTANSFAELNVRFADACASNERSLCGLECKVEHLDEAIHHTRLPSVDDLDQFILHRLDGIVGEDQRPELQEIEHRLTQQVRRLESQRRSDRERTRHRETYLSSLILTLEERDKARVEAPESWKVFFCVSVASCVLTLLCVHWLHGSQQNFVLY